MSKISHTTLAFEYRPHLDGLRAVSVTVVLAFHSGLSFFSSGFIGVDIFFVLSGFLVCNVVLAEAMNSGRIDLIGFWARRMKRLLPAASATILGTSLLALLFIPLSQRVEFQSSARASSLWYANWHFIASSKDYFAAEIDKSPFLHFWSLAIEEQFYAFFPILFLIIGKIRAHKMKALFVITAALCLISLGLQWLRSDENRSYMGTDTRVYQILLGVLLAICLKGRSERKVTKETRNSKLQVDTFTLLLAVSLILISSNIFELSTSLRGVIASLAATLLIFGLEIGEELRLKRLLQSKLLTEIGKLSYGIYLWHWPVLVSLNHYRPLHPLVQFLVCFATSVCFAILSLRFLENPIRNSKSGNSRVTLALGIIVALFVGSIAAPSVLAIASPPLFEEKQTLQRGTPNNWEVISRTSLEKPLVGGCSIDETASCVAVEGSGQEVLLVGDSHAAMFFPALKLIAEQNNWRLSTATEPGCPWGNGVLPRQKKNTLKCSEFHQVVYEEIVPSSAPDLLILVNRTQVDDRVEGGSRQAVDESLNLMTASIERLRTHSQQIVIIEPMPEFEDRDFFPRDCLATATFLEECSRPMTDSLVEDELFRSVADSDPGVFSLALDDLICESLEACAPVKNDILIIRDRTHISVDYSEFLAEEISTRIDRILSEVSS